MSASYGKYGVVIINGVYASYVYDGKTYPVERSSPSYYRYIMEYGNYCAEKQSVVAVTPGSANNLSSAGGFEDEYILLAGIVFSLYLVLLVLIIVKFMK